MSTKAKRIKLNANEIQFEAKILEGYQSTFIVVSTQHNVVFIIH